MHDRTPGLPLSFSLLRTLFMLYSIIISLFLFNVIYEHIRISLNVYIQLLIPVILLTSNFLMFLCGDWYRTLAIILRGQHSTPRLQGAGEGGIFVNPKR